ncbi:unnamed protein product [Aphanomyces euteiches]
MKLQAVKDKNALASFPGQTALIVGATAGIGEAIAYRLARAQFNVLIAGRNKTRGNQVVEGLQGINPKGEHGFVPLDAELISNIHGLSTKVPPIDKLVLTQAIQGYTPTSEGIDQKLALHYFSRMAVIHEFLPVLQQSKHSPRVLSILSGGNHSPYKQFHEDPELKKNYSLKNAADTAGYYNDLMLDAWSEKADNSGIAFAHLAPGVVATNSGTKMP